MALAELALALGPAALGLTWLKEVATVLFFLFFVGVLALLAIRGRRHYEPHSRMPLEDEPVEPREER